MSPLGAIGAIGAIGDRDLCVHAHVVLASPIPMNACIYVKKKDLCIGS